MTRRNYSHVSRSTLIPYKDKSLESLAFGKNTFGKSMKHYFDQLCQLDMERTNLSKLVFRILCIMMTILWSYVLSLMSIKYMFQKDLCFKADENICSIWQITCFKAILVQASFSPFNMFPPDIWREPLSGQFEKDEFYDLQFLF